MLSPSAGAGSGSLLKIRGQVRNLPQCLERWSGALVETCGDIMKLTSCTWTPIVRAATSEPRVISFSDVAIHYMQQNAAESASQSCLGGFVSRFGTCIRRQKLPKNLRRRGL